MTQAVAAAQLDKTYRFMEVQQGNSQQVKFIYQVNFMRSGCGDLENPTFGSESRNYIN